MRYSDSLVCTGHPTDCANYVLFPKEKLFGFNKLLIDLKSVFYLASSPAGNKLRHLQYCNFLYIIKLKINPGINR